MEAEATSDTDRGGAVSQQAELELADTRNYSNRKGVVRSLKSKRRHHPLALARGELPDAFIPSF